MKKILGKKTYFREIEDYELEKTPHYFIGGKYSGYCNENGKPHGKGKLSSNENKNIWIC